jgi:hypothetical protein
VSLAFELVLYIILLTPSLRQLEVLVMTRSTRHSGVSMQIGDNWDGCVIETHCICAHITLKGSIDKMINSGWVSSRRRGGKDKRRRAARAHWTRGCGCTPTSTPHFGKRCRITQGVHTAIRGCCLRSTPAASASPPAPVYAIMRSSSAFSSVTSARGWSHCASSLGGTSEQRTLLYIE